MRRRIATDEATVAEDRHLHETHLAKERLPRLRSECERLAAQVSFGEEGLRLIESGLSYLRNLDDGRELSLAITHAEDAITRLRNHLGTCTD